MGLGCPPVSTRGATISASRFSSQRCLPNGLLDGGWIGWIWVRLISGKKKRTLPQIILENDSWHMDIGCQISKTQPFFRVWELKQVSWELLKMIYQPEIWPKFNSFPCLKSLEKLPRHWCRLDSIIKPSGSYLSNHSKPSSPWMKGKIDVWNLHIWKIRWFQLAFPLESAATRRGWMISNSSWNWSYLTGGLVSPSVIGKENAVRKLGEVKTIQRSDHFYVEKVDDKAVDGMGHLIMATLSCNQFWRCLV